MSFISLLKHYYICVPLSKYISFYIIYYTGITPVFTPMTSNLIEKPIHVIITFIIHVVRYIKNKHIIKRL
jgi:hypothetical protein